MTSPADPLNAATQRLIDDVESLSDEDWAAPSTLPGWSRGHVIAHLVLNAEGLAGAVLGVIEGRPRPMYVSDEARDADIADLAATHRAPLWRRFEVASARLDEAFSVLAEAPAEVAESLMDRTPGGRRFAAGAAPGMRLREIEIHHVDLGVGYSPADWPVPFVRELLGYGFSRPVPGVDALLVASDLDWRHQPGTGGPTVTGPAHGLAWWLTGRPPYEGIELRAEGGELPRIGAL